MELHWGLRPSSAQITSLYTTQMLIGKLVIAVTNLKPLSKLDVFISEVLLLGVDGKNDGDIILITPDDKADIGVTGFIKRDKPNETKSNRYQRYT